MAAVPLNMCPVIDSPVDYIKTGMFSKKAVEEATRYCKINLLWDDITEAPTPDYLRAKMDPNACYLYYCDNESGQGVEFSSPPPTLPGVPLVADLTSNLMTKQFDISQFGCILLSAQKNFGVAGLTMVIVREDLIGKGMELPGRPGRKLCPGIVHWKEQSEMESLFNTPPCYS